MNAPTNLLIAQLLWALQETMKEYECSISDAFNNHREGMADYLRGHAQLPPSRVNKLIDWGTAASKGIVK